MTDITETTTKSDLLFISLDLLHENPDNPRVIKRDKFNKLVDSLVEFPQMLLKRPLIAISCDNGYTVIGGNMRLKAIPAAIKRLKKLLRNGDANSDKWNNNIVFFKNGIPVILADDWSPEMVHEFIVKDNVNYGEHDWELLANQYDRHQLFNWGLDIPDMEEVPSTSIDDDFMAELPEEPITMPGDLYEFGENKEHRLICADVKDLEAMEQLMEDMKCNLLFTSPPYWVGKSYETEKSEDEIDDFIMKSVESMISITNPDYGRIVINTGTASINRIEKKRKAEILPLIDKWQHHLRLYGWLMRHLRIWVKRGQLPASISPKTDVIDQHNEYIATFEQEWSQVLTFWQPDGVHRGQERLGTPWAQQGVWDDVHGQKSAGGRHIAAFPIDIPFRNILLYTKKGEIVCDVFAGSGTTMIACDQIKRRCFLVERLPGYCDVIVKRYIQWRAGRGQSVVIHKNGNLIDHGQLYSQ